MLPSLTTLIGRLLLALLFILSGLSKIGSTESTVAYMTAKGMSFAPFFLYGAILLELAGGVSLATGFRARIGALLLILFMVPTTYIFHIRGAFDAQFNLVDPKELIQILKNLAIIGGLLMIYGNGAGKLTIGKDS
jgi:putative oxidoreductase